MSAIPQEVIDRFVAASHGDLDTVRSMLEATPTLLGAPARWRETPLQAASHAGSPAAAEALVGAGADVNQGEGGNTALHGAARMGHRAMAAWLLDHGAHVNALDFEGKTPLRLALDAGHHDVAALLRERGGREEGAGTR